MEKNGLEIERKFLIKYPDCKMLSDMENTTVMKMSQTYLEDNSRIRKIEQDGKVYYIKTVKERISELVRREREWSISESEYLMSLSLKKTGTKTIEKTRYAVKKDGFVYEIDVFDFWNDRAFLEIELKSAEQKIKIPDFVEVIKEVTFESQYKNFSLAHTIITEPLDI